MTSSPTLTPPTEPPSNNFPSAPLPAPAKKSRRKLWIVLGVVGGLAVIGGISGATNSKQDLSEGITELVPETTEAPATTEAPTTAAAPEPTTTPAPEPTTTIPEPTTTAAPAAAPAPIPETTEAPPITEASPATTEAPPTTETASQENARRKAADYLDFLSFSRSGLIDQLEYEGFTQADAIYGVDALDVDWNEQAAKKAADYLDTMAFSRSGLIDQLVYEGFTQEQTTYGVDTTGL